MTPEEYRVHLALHILWTKAVGTLGYKKAEWIELDNAIRAIEQKNSEKKD